jgi:hypothetical protein
MCKFTAHECTERDCKGPQMLEIGIIEECEHPFWDSNGIPRCQGAKFLPVPASQYHRICDYCFQSFLESNDEPNRNSDPSSTPDNKVCGPQLPSSTNKEQPLTDVSFPSAEVAQNASKPRPQSELLVALLGEGQEYIRPLKFFDPIKHELGDGRQVRYAEIRDEFKDHLNPLDFEYKRD